MSHEIILTRQDVVNLTALVTAFAKSDEISFVRLKADSSSGIGTIVTATIDNVVINGQHGSFTKTLVDESSW